MTTFLRKTNTGVTVFDTLDEYLHFKNSLSSLKAYNEFWVTWLNAGLIDPVLDWSGFGTSLIVLRANFTTRDDIDAYLAAVAHLDEARDITHATLGWTVTREIVD